MKDLLEKIFRKIDSLKEKVEEAKEYRRILEGFNRKEYKNAWHFEFVEHYGEGSRRYQIYPRHNERFYEVIRQILEETEGELEGENIKLDEN